MSSAVKRAEQRAAAKAHAGADTPVARAEARANPMAPARLGGSLSGSTPGSAAKRRAPAAKKLTLAQATAPSADERAVKRENAGLGSIPGGKALRALGHAAGAVVEETVSHPLRSTAKAAGTLKDAAKGSVAVVGGLPVVLAKDIARDVTHPTSGFEHSQAGDIAKRLVHEEGQRISKTYGPSYRGEKGAFKHLRKQVHEEGPLPVALDIATALAPTSSALGRAARVADKAGTGGRAVRALAKASTERPALRVNPVHDAVEQRPRPSAAGAAVTMATDAARRGATKHAVKRAAKTGKPLRADRALLNEGEVAPLTRIGANRKLRTAAATNKTRETQAAHTRVEAQVTGTKGETLRNVRNSVPVELHPLIDIAKRLGIRDSAGAKAAIPARIARIEEDRKIALAKTGKQGKRDAAAEAQAKGADGELALLRELEKDPTPFDNPAIAAAADAEGRLARKSGGAREGLGEERAALGRSENLGHTLGVKTAAHQNAEAKAAHAATLDEAKAEVKAAAAERDKVRATSERVLSGARADLAKAKGRAEVLSRSVTGRNTLGKAGPTKYAGGGVGVKQAEEALARAQAAVDTKLGAATERLKTARETHKTTRAAGPDYGVRHGKVSTDKEFDAVMENVGHTIDSASATVVHDLSNWQHGVEVGKPNVLRHEAEVHKAFEPVREHLRKTHGDTLRLYRGTKPGFVDDGRALTAWTLNKKMAESYGTKVEERQVPVDDIVAALGESKKMPAGGDYNEFIVRRPKPRATPLKKVSETAAEYEARVAEANRELHPNLVAPEYAPAGFEREGFRVNGPTNGPSNPLAKRSHGTLDRLGRNESDYKLIEHDMIAKLTKGAAHEYESNLIRDHGKVFSSLAAANRWAAEHGLNADPALGRVDIEFRAPTNGIIRKDLAPVKIGKRGEPVKNADHGDYHATDAVVAFPKAIAKELDDLKALETRGQGPISKALRGAAHYSQAILLGGSLSWFQFQRVNDLVAAGVGGSLIHTRALNRALKGLDEEDRQLVHIMSGGTISSAALKPNAAMELGRLKQLLDSSPAYQRALNSKTPMGALLRANGGENPLTGLLRADQAVTSGFRERQFIHNLTKFAERNDARVAGINKGLAPLGDAFKTGDMAAVSRLLKDPANRKLVEDAAQQLYKVHGDWHNFTAAERRFGATAAFYGFLRYSTRMALFTLPLGHPYISLLLAQLGGMGAADAKAIIGPDQPWGLGALYNADGTVAADFTRANPLLSPLANLNKPEDVIGLATPLASIVASYITGQPIGLSDSAEGYIRQFTTHGDPQNHRLGGFTSPERLRIALRQVLGLAAPIREWDKFDSQQQSDDTLPWSRRYLRSESPSAQLRIDDKNKSADSGLHGLLHREIPLVAPGSSKNLKVQGESIAAGKTKAAQAEELRQAKRHYTLDTGTGRIEAAAAKAEARAEARTQAVTARADEAARKATLRATRLGG